MTDPGPYAVGADHESEFGPYSTTVPSGKTHQAQPPRRPSRPVKTIMEYIEITQWVAKSDPLECENHPDSMGPTRYYCTYCRAESDLYEDYEENPIVEHADDCLWVRARKLVGDNGDR